MNLKTTKKNIMKTTGKFFFIPILLLNIVFVNAQMINEGIMHIDQGTLMSVMFDFSNSEMGEYENNGEVLFKGNFNNDGVTGFNPLFSGYTRFEGMDRQVITGNIPANFNNVLFNNASTQPAFRLSADVSIKNNADFYLGIVQSDGYGGSIVFEDNGTHTNTSDDSYVDGAVFKNGGSDFVYPVGDKGYYRFSATSTSGNTGNSFNVQYFLENSNVLYPHTNKTGVIELIDNKEYWVIKKDEGKDDVLITLSWNENATTPTEIILLPQEAIHIVRWDETLELWVDEGGIIDIDKKTVTTISNVSGYGVFTIARVKTDIIMEGDIVIYNGVSPDGDGHNDYFLINGINRFPKNKVAVYNRWGVKVFETSNYDSSGNVFMGKSEERATISSNSMLPSGTYFYIVEYEYNLNGQDSKTIKKAGYLYLNAE